MKQDRFLIGILVGIGVLIVIALTLFFVRKDTQTYVSEDTPEGVVRNYVLAVLNKDYQKAYSYLADKEHKPTYDQFRQAFFSGMVSPTNVGVNVGKAQVDGDAAVVELGLVYSPNDPFSTGYQNQDRALLTKQNGAWKLTSLPYNFWLYEWYQVTPQAPKVP